MRTLLVFDEKNYTDDMPLVEKWAVRAVILRDGKIATQHGKRGDYKILGGGIEKGEDYAEALYREVLEEAGLLVKKESVRPLGEALEIREDIFEGNQKYICHSYFFLCEIEDESVEPQMTESEISQGYHLEWVDLKKMIRENEKFCYQQWIKRDTAFVELIVNGTVEV